MNAEDWIGFEEGKRRFVYDDNGGAQIIRGYTVKGNPSIGIGRNLVGEGLDDDEIAYLFNKDVTRFTSHLQTYSWWAGLSQVRQAALLNLCFNEGAAGFDGFHHMIAAIEAGDFTGAASQIIQSKGYLELPHRYQRIADAIHYDTWPTLPGA